MRILIIGGTVFVGRHIVLAACNRGYEITLFNRGIHNPELFPDVQHIKGDRTTDLALLDGNAWDVVIDTCGYLPSVVHQSVEALQGKVSQYVFISTISVYQISTQVPIRESSPLQPILDLAQDKVTMENYGPLKGLCEEEVLKAFGHHALIVRPGLIVGPNDPTGRFTYWLERTRRGGDIAVPGTEDYPAQYTDVRDLAEWIVKMIENNNNGVYNAVGPALPSTMGELLHQVKHITERDAHFHFIPEEELTEPTFEPLKKLPYWIPKEAESLYQVDNTKAKLDELCFRPLRETVLDTLNWVANTPDQSTHTKFLSPEDEQSVLSNWFRKES